MRAARRRGRRAGLRHALPRLCHEPREVRGGVVRLQVVREPLRNPHRQTGRWEAVYYGSRCEKYDVDRHAEADASLPDLFAEREALLMGTASVLRADADACDTGGSGAEVSGAASGPRAARGPRTRGLANRRNAMTCGAEQASSDERPAVAGGMVNARGPEGRATFRPSASPRLPSVPGRPDARTTTRGTVGIPLALSFTKCSPSGARSSSRSGLPSSRRAPPTAARAARTRERGLRDLLPVKVAHGHTARTPRQETDVVFVPSFIDARSEGLTNGDRRGASSTAPSSRRSPTRYAARSISPNWA